MLRRLADSGGAGGASTPERGASEKRDKSRSPSARKEKAAKQMVAKERKKTRQLVLTMLVGFAVQSKKRKQVEKSMG